MASMLFRFSLYGFLKNQRYFEAFLYLAFLDKGLDFFQIGMLVGLRSLAVSVMEIPSGAIADVFGRRHSLVLSLLAYIGGFVVLGAVRQLGPLAAMVASTQGFCSAAPKSPPERAATVPSAAYTRARPSTYTAAMPTGRPPPVCCREK